MFIEMNCFIDSIFLNSFFFHFYTLKHLQISPIITTNWVCATWVLWINGSAALLKLTLLRIWVSFAKGLQPPFLLHQIILETEEAQMSWRLGFSIHSLFFKNWTKLWRDSNSRSNSVIEFNFFYFKSFQKKTCRQKAVCQVYLFYRSRTVQRYFSFFFNKP